MDSHRSVLPELSRRKVLQAAALTAASCAVSGLAAHGRGDEPAAGSQPNAKPQKAGLADSQTGAIDAHVHVWTPDTERYALAPGFRRDEMKPPSFTPEELFSHARPCGVARVVLIQMSFYGFNNAYMLDTMHRFPGVFSGV